MQTSRIKYEVGDYEDIDRAIEQFERLVKKEDILYEYKQSQRYTPNTKERRDAEHAARQREKKRDFYG